jgi:hypothetical protein
VVRAITATRTTCFCGKWTEEKTGIAGGKQKHKEENISNILSRNVAGCYKKQLVKAEGSL